MATKKSIKRIVENASFDITCAGLTLAAWESMKPEQQRREFESLLKAYASSLDKIAAAAAK